MEERVHTGRTALVTGGARDIGAAKAKSLARQGAAVALCARSEKEVACVAEQIAASGGAALPLRMDVADEGSAAGMATYSASTAALDQLTHVLAPEGEPYNIATVGVYPGVVDTRMQEYSRSPGPELVGGQLHRMFRDHHDFGMLRRPEEPADLISYLCAPPPDASTATSSASNSSKP